MNSQQPGNYSNENDGNGTCNIELAKRNHMTPIEKLQNDDHYEPYDRREVLHPLSNNEATVHLLKVALGTGILSMPKAIHHSGYLVGAIGTIVIGLICVYMMQILLRSHYELCKRKKVPCMDYATTAKNAVLEGPDWMHKYAKHTEHITIGLLLVYQIGSCCIYVIFIAVNVKSIVEYVTDTHADIRFFMLAILIPIVLINWVRNLKYLAVFSAVANCLTAASFGIIFYFIFREPIQTSGRRLYGPIDEFPLFIGIVLFSLESVGIIMPIENEMKTPAAYVGKTGVLSRAFAIIVVLYIAMGLFGYLRFGDGICESITLSLDSQLNETDRIDIILAQCVKGLLAFGVFISDGIASHVAIDIIWRTYVVDKIQNHKNALLWEYVLRTAVVILTFLLAVAIPKLDLFISLFGAFCLSILGIIFPATIENLVFIKTKSGMSKYMLIVRNSLFIIFGLFALIIGTSTTVSAIIKSFN